MIPVEKRTADTGGVMDSLSPEEMVAPRIVNDMSRFVIVELPAPVTHDQRKQIAERIASALEPKPDGLRVFLCSEEHGCNLVPGEYYWRKDVDALLAAAVARASEMEARYDRLTLTLAAARSGST